MKLELFTDEHTLVRLAHALNVCSCDGFHSLLIPTNCLRLCNEAAGEAVGLLTVCKSVYHTDAHVQLTSMPKALMAWPVAWFMTDCYSIRR